MNAEHVKILIAAVGSPKAFATRLGIYGEPRWSQTVENWRVRGIPPRIQLDRARQLRGLQRTAKRRGLLT